MNNLKAVSSCASWVFFAAEFAQCLWPLDRHCTQEARRLSLLFGIAQRCCETTGTEGTCDRLCWARWNIHVISIKAEKSGLVTFSSEIWHIKYLKWLQFGEGGVKWLIPDCSSKGFYLQKSLRWSHCSNNLLVGMYWLDLSTQPLPTVHLEFFFLLMRGSSCVLLCLCYAF